MGVTTSDALIAFHDWKLRLRMERSYREDRNPYRTPDVSERRKRAALIALISDRKYCRALDVGCGEGGLTREIAPYCENLLATDISGAAIWRAMVNLADVSNVSFARRNVREEDDLAGWDLIVLSDVLPFLDTGDRSRVSVSAVCRRLAGRLNPGGRLVAVNPVPAGAPPLNCGVWLSEGAPVRLQRELLTAAGEGETRYAVSVFERPEPARVPAGLVPVRSPIIFDRLVSR